MTPPALSYPRLRLDARDAVDHQQRRSRQAGDETLLVKDAIRFAERDGWLADGEREKPVMVKESRRAGGVSPLILRSIKGLTPPARP